MKALSKNPIAISLSPNTFASDLRRAWGSLLSPWKWRHTSAARVLETRFGQYHSGGNAVSFESGRTSWQAILVSLGVTAGDEVLLQAYTCVVVANPILWCGAKPVYVDIDAQTCIMDLSDLEQKITSRSKVLLIQHTFGMMADMGRVMEIARRHHLVVVEDCAHALGAEQQDQQGVWRRAGTYGDAAFYSFGRDKIISSVYGGMALTSDPQLFLKLRAYQQTLPIPSRRWIAQQLLHPILFSLIVPLYFVGNAGKVILVVCQKLGLLSKAVYPCEKQGRQHGSMPRQFPDALAVLALRQFDRLDEFNDRRRLIADRYRQELSPLWPQSLLVETAGTRSAYLRFALQTSAPERLLASAGRQHILLGDWYQQPIAPGNVAYAAIGYVEGSCPVAESRARTTINLPTYPRLSDQDVERIIDLMKKEFQP